MKRIETLLARLFTAVTSVVVTFALVEAGANFYLLHIASVDEFNELASINQIKARYGDDVFENSDIVTEAGTDGILYVPHHYLGYTLKPSFQRGNNRHNSLGFRGAEIALEKPENVYRIATLGGSTTYGEFVPDYTDSYPHQLEDYLRQNGYSQAEVVNAGIPAYSSYQSLINLTYRVLPLEPDLLIFYQGYNDIHTRFVYPYSNYVGDNSGFIAPYVSDTVMPAIWEYSTALRILGIRAGATKPHAALDWHRLSPADSNWLGEFSKQWLQGAYPNGIFAEVSGLEMLENNPPVHFQRNMRNMIAIANAHEIDVLVSTFATSPIFDEPTVASDEYVFALAQHNDLTRQVAQSTGTAFYDFAADFSDDPALFTDGRHMTQLGNRIRAQLVGDFVIAEFLQ